MSVSIVGKSIKEKLMSSQRIDSLWESFCDCIAPELNNVRIVGDEIKNLYDINKTSDYKSLGEMFGYSPNLIIKNNKSFQKLEIESISDRIKNKTTYDGYNIGAKQINKDSNTFNFYWNGSKLIRAIKVGETYQNLLSWNKSSNFDGVVPDKNFSEVQSSFAKLDDGHKLDKFRLDYNYIKKPTHHIGVEYINKNYNYEHVNVLKTEDCLNYYIYLIFIHNVDSHDISVLIDDKVIEPLNVSNDYITYENGYIDLLNGYVNFNFDEVDENREVLIKYFYKDYLIDYLYFNYLDKCSSYNKRVPIVSHNGYQINDKTSYLSTNNNITSYLLPINELNFELVKLDTDLRLDGTWNIDEFKKSEDVFDIEPKYVKFGTKIKRNIYPYKTKISNISKYFSLSTFYSDKSVTLDNVSLKIFNDYVYSTKECSYLKNNSQIKINNNDCSFEFFFIILEDGEIYNNSDLRIYAENNNLHFVSKTEVILPFEYGNENRVLFQYDDYKYQIYKDNTTDYFTVESNKSVMDVHIFGKYNDEDSYVGYIWNVITRNEFIESDLIIDYIYNNYEVIFTDVRNPIKQYELSSDEIYTSNDVQYMVNTIISYPQLDDNFSENNYKFIEKPKPSSIILTDGFGKMYQRPNNTIIDENNTVVGYYDDSLSQLFINENVVLMDKKEIINSNESKKTLTKIIYKDGSIKYFDDNVEETNTLTEISEPIFIEGEYKTTNGNTIFRDSNNNFYLNGKIINPVYIEEYYDSINFKIGNKFYNSFKNIGLNEIKKVRLNELYDNEYDLYSIGGKLYLYPELNSDYEVRIWRIENTYESTEVNIYDDNTFDTQTVENNYYTYSYSLGINTRDLYDSLSFTRKIDKVSDVEITDYTLINQDINYEIENWKISTLNEVEETKNELIAYVDDKKLILTQSSNVSGKRLNIESDPTILIVNKEKYTVDCKIQISVSKIDDYSEYTPIDKLVTVIYTLSNGETKITTCDKMGLFNDEYISGYYTYGDKHLDIELKDDSLMFVNFMYQYTYTKPNKHYNQEFKINYQLVNPLDVSEIGIYNSEMQLLFYSTFPYIELIDNSYISLCLLLDYER